MVSGAGAERYAHIFLDKQPELPFKFPRSSIAHVLMFRCLVAWSYNEIPFKFVPPLGTKSVQLIFFDQNLNTAKNLTNSRNLLMSNQPLVYVSRLLQFRNELSYNLRGYFKITTPFVIQSGVALLLK